MKQHTRGSVDLCPARTKMKINVINLRPRTHIFYLDLSSQRWVCGGSCRDSTEQKWAYSSFMIGPTQSEMILRSIQVQGLSCCSFNNMIRINIHLFLTVQRKRKHRQLYSKYPLRTLHDFIGVVGMSKGYLLFTQWIIYSPIPRGPTDHIKG
jgi:hypothetical protein